MVAILAIQNIAETGLEMLGMPLLRNMSLKLVNGFHNFLLFEDYEMYFITIDPKNLWKTTAATKLIFCPSDSRILRSSREKRRIGF